MSPQFLSCLAASLIVSGFVACGSDDTDDDDDDDRGSSTTTQTTATTATTSGGSGGTEASSNTRGTVSTTQGSGGATTTAGPTTSATGSGVGGAAGSDGGMAGATALVDEEILHIARTANLGEVEQGQVAVQRADDPEVLDFADDMVDDHSEAVTEADEVATSEGLSPRSNPVSQMLQTESEQIVVTLQGASDEEFDLVYMNAQVTAHQEVLTLLEDALIPQAENPVLISYLVDLREDVEEHLSEAEFIVDSLE